MKQINITALTKRELDAVIAAANFSKDQEAIFNELNKDTLYDIGIMEKLGIPPRRYYDTKRVTIEKTVKLLREYGYNHAINHNRSTPKC